MDNDKLIRSLRLQLLIERIAIAVIALTFITIWTVGHFTGGKSLILVDGKPIACVPSANDAEVVLCKIKSDTGCNPSEVEFRQKVRIARAPYDAEPVSRNRAYSAVRRAVCPLIPKWAIIVDGKPLAALPDQKTAGEALELAKMKYGSMVKNLVEEPQFKEEVKVDIASVPLTLYCQNAQEAVDLMFSGRPTETTDALYTVANGDIAVVIASRHGLSLEELEKINPGVNLARLQIGDQIHVKAAKSVGPKLTVVVRDQTDRTESIPAPVQRVSSAQLFTGESTTLSAGKAGERRVKVATIYENGIQTGTEIVDEQILREPVPTRIAMGIKTKRN